MAIIVQTLRKELPSDIQKAIKYFQLLSVLNSIKLTNKEIELLGFTCVRGTINQPAGRKEFVEMFDSSLPSLANSKADLIRRGWLVKIEGKCRVNPSLQLDFTKDIVLQIKLSTNEGNHSPGEP